MLDTETRTWLPVTATETLRQERLSTNELTQAVDSLIEQHGYKDLFKNFQRAEMVQYDSPEQFFKAAEYTVDSVCDPLNPEAIGTLNFICGLQADSSTVIGEALRAKPAYQRARCLAPAFTASVEQRMQQKGAQPTDHRLQAEVYDFYCLSSLLVDKEHDVGVWRSSTKQVDPYYLLR